MEIVLFSTCRVAVKSINCVIDGKASNFVVDTLLSA